MSNTIRLKNLSEIPSKTATILTTRRVKHTEITNDTRYAESYKAQLRTQVDQEARDSLEALQSQSTEAADRVRASLQKPTDARSTEERVLAELKAERKFRQIERRLNAGHDPLQITQELAQSGDREALRVLRDELPSVLAARGQGDASIKGVLEYVDRATEPLMSSEELASRETATELDRAVYFADSAVNWASHELEGGSPVVVLGTAAGDTIKVGE